MPTYAPYAAAITPTPAANHLALARRYDFWFMPRPYHFDMSRVTGRDRLDAFRDPQLPLVLCVEKIANAMPAIGRA